MCVKSHAEFNRMLDLTQKERENWKMDKEKAVQFAKDLKGSGLLSLLAGGPNLLQVSEWTWLHAKISGLVNVILEEPKPELVNVDWTKPARRRINKMPARLIGVSEHSGALNICIEFQTDSELDRWDHSWYTKSTMMEQFENVPEPALEVGDAVEAVNKCKFKLDNGDATSRVFVVSLDPFLLADLDGVLADRGNEPKHVKRYDRLHREVLKGLLAKVEANRPKPEPVGCPSLVCEMAIATKKGQNTKFLATRYHFTGYPEAIHLESRNNRSEWLEDEDYAISIGYTFSTWEQHTVGRGQETKENIAGAVARGWCSQRNANKVMDPDLAMDITNEVFAVARGRAGNAE